MNQKEKENENIIIPEKIYDKKVDMFIDEDPDYSEGFSLVELSLLWE